LIRGVSADPADIPPPDAAGFPPVLLLATRTDRRNGYLRGMARHGLDEFSSIIEGDFTERSGSAVAEQLLAERELPTAVVP
jgi:DNA-binding LacI/PurR family transcriptional regulator